MPVDVHHFVLCCVACMVFTCSLGPRKTHHPFVIDILWVSPMSKQDSIPDTYKTEHFLLSSTQVTQSRPHTNSMDCGAWLIKEIYATAFFDILHRMFKVQHYYTLLTGFTINMEAPPLNNWDSNFTVDTSGITFEIMQRVS